MPSEVLQHEGNFFCFHVTPAVVDALLEGCHVSGELADFCLNDLLLLFTLSIAYDLGVGLPYVQLVCCFGKDIKSCAWAAEQLEEPWCHGFDRGA